MHHLYYFQVEHVEDMIGLQLNHFYLDEMADEENDIYRNLFGDIIQTYEVYDFVPQTEASIYALAYTEDEYKRFLKEWAPPFIGS